MGEFRVFEGVFEKAAANTEALAEALADLSGEEPDVTELLFEGYALMSLSEAIAERAHLARVEYGGGARASAIELPPSDRLSALGRRVQFRLPDLALMRAPYPLLRLYLLDLRSTADKRKPLRHRPIVTDGTAFVVGAPSFLLAA